MNVGDLELLLLNKLLDRMKLDLDMLDRGVASLILHKLGHHIIVTEQRGRFLRQEAKSIQELPKECHFMGGLMQGNIFYVT